MDTRPEVNGYEFAKGRAGSWSEAIDSYRNRCTRHGIKITAEEAMRVIGAAVSK